MRQGDLLRLFIFVSVCCIVAGQGQRPVCESLFRCLNTRLLCPVLFSYYNCTVPTGQPACGESWVTGSASQYTMPRVVGGVDAKEREFPWTVHVISRDSRATMCGGSIIDNNVVLTAAHCVSALLNRPSALEVGYGSTSRDRLTYVEASRIIMHPNYNTANSDNDIAIIILRESLPLNESTNLRSVCLPNRGRSYPRAAECIVTGWGLLEDAGSRIPDILQKAAVPLVPRDRCESSYSNNPRILVSDRQLCAGLYNEGGIDACRGDSGGPLVCPDGDRWVLYGVVSTGQGCAQARFPGVYVHVGQYVDWIRSQIY